MMRTLRQHQTRSAAFNAALYLLLWLSPLLSPCLMAMHAGVHDVQQPPCAHCPPVVCDHNTGLQTTGCDQLDQTAVRGYKDELPSWSVALQPFEWRIGIARRYAVPPPAGYTPLKRAGPRLHLLHAQFNE